MPDPLIPMPVFLFVVNMVLWMAISTLLTGIMLVRTGTQPNFWTGIVCGVAFTFGVIAAHIPIIG